MAATIRHARIGRAENVGNFAVQHLAFTAAALLAAATLAACLDEEDNGSPSGCGATHYRHHPPPHSDTAELNSD